MTAPQTRGLLLRGVGVSRRTVTSPFAQGVAGRSVTTPFEQSGPLASATYSTPFWQWGYGSRTILTPMDQNGSARSTVETPFSVLDGTVGVDDWGGIIQPSMGWVEQSAPDLMGYRDTLVSTPGIRGYWRFGEASGSVAADALGMSPGTIAANVTLAQPGMLAGDADKAFRFLSGGYVDVPDPAAVLHPGDDVVLSCIVQRTSSGAEATVWSGGAGELQVGFDATNHIVIKKQGTGTIWTSTPTYTTARLHLVVYKQGAAFGAYVDGAAVAGSGSNATLVATTGAVRIGLLTGGTEPLIAYLDEVALLTGVDPAALAQTLHARAVGA